MKTTLSNYQEGLDQLLRSKHEQEQKINRAVSVFLVVAVIVILAVFTADHFGLVHLIS